MGGWLNEPASFSMVVRFFFFFFYVFFAAFGVANEHGNQVSIVSRS